MQIFPRELFQILVLHLGLRKFHLYYLFSLSRLNNQWGIGPILTKYYPNGWAWEWKSLNDTLRK